MLPRPLYILAFGEEVGEEQGAVGKLFTLRTKTEVPDCELDEISKVGLELLKAMT